MNQPERKMRQRGVRDAIIMANAGGEPEILQMLVTQFSISKQDVENCELEDDYERGKNQIVSLIKI